jgi:hypothetical protein
MTSKQPLWVPTDVESTNIVQFIKHVNKKYSLQLHTYEDIWQWSVNPNTLPAFWAEACVFLGIAPGPLTKDDALPGFNATNRTPVMLLQEKSHGTTSH